MLRGTRHGLCKGNLESTLHSPPNSPKVESTSTAFIVSMYFPKNLHLNEIRTGLIILILIVHNTPIDAAVKLRHTAHRVNTD